MSPPETEEILAGLRNDDGTSVATYEVLPSGFRVRVESRFATTVAAIDSHALASLLRRAGWQVVLPTPGAEP